MDIANKINLLTWAALVVVLFGMYLSTIQIDVLAKQRYMSKSNLLYKLLNGYYYFRIWSTFLNLHRCPD